MSQNENKVPVVGFLFLLGYACIMAYGITYAISLPPEPNMRFPAHVQPKMAVAKTPAEQKTADEIAAKIQAVRTKLQLTSVKLSIPVANAAQGKTQSMQEEQYFAHGEFAGFFKAFTNLKYTKVGEILSEGYIKADGTVNTDAVIKAWLASPTHYAELSRDQYEVMGVGVTYGTYQGHKTCFISVLFADLQ